LAARYGVSPDKVLAWIRSGELRAINVSARRGGRPRYLIDVADLAAFENAREAARSEPVRQRPRRKPVEGVIEYF
jgi:hypothetical protein